MKKQKNEGYVLQTMVSLIILMVISIFVFSSCGGGPTSVVPVVPTNTPGGNPTPIPEYGNIQGTIYENNGTTPIVNAFIVYYSHIFGAELSSSQSNMFTATTGPNGVYQINSVFAGPGRMSFYRDQNSFQNDPNNPLGAVECTVIANQTTTVNGTSGQIDPTPTPTTIPTPPTPGNTPTNTPVPTNTPGGTNQAPLAPVDPLPANGAVNQPLTVTLQVTANDPEGNPMNVSFFKQNGDLIGTDTNVAHGGQATVNYTGLANNTSYSWYARANDGSLDGPNSSTFTFTTVPVANQAPNAPVNPAPAHNATNIPINTALSVTYQDPEGIAGSTKFYWQGSPPTLIDTDASTASGGTATINVTGLNYSTTYNWFAVNNDGALDSAQSTVWSFTTTAAPPTPDPNIANVVNSYCAEGESITITGTDFGATQGTGSVKINDVNATDVVWGDTQITCKVPIGGFLGNDTPVPFVVTRDDSKTASFPDFRVYQWVGNIFPTALTYKPKDLFFDGTGNNFYIRGRWKTYMYAFPSMAKSPNETADTFLEGYYGCFCNNNNRIYVATADRVYHYDANLGDSQQFGLGSYSNSRGISYHPTNNKIYCVNAVGGPNITTQNLDGTSPSSFSIGIFNEGIDIDEDGNTYTSGNEVIEKYDSSNSLVGTPITRHDPRYLYAKKTLFGHTLLYSTGGGTSSDNIIIFKNGVKIGEIIMPDATFALAGIDGHNQYKLVVDENNQNIMMFID